MALVLESLDDLKEFLGRELASTEWFLVTQDRIQKFADSTEDHQWIHTDRERAERESPYRTTVAHGFLTLSLLSHFISEALQIRNGAGITINYGLNRVRFPAPVPADSKVRARFIVQTIDSVSSATEVVYQVRVEAEASDKPCCVAEWVVRYYR